MPLTNKNRAYIQLKPGNTANGKKVLNPTLNEKQKEAMRILIDHKNGVNSILYGGGAGGGKSYLGCLWIVSNALKFPKTRHLIGGKELKKLKHTTLKTLFGEVMRDLGFDEKTHYKYSELRSEIRLFNGSEIIIMDLADRPNDPEFEFLGSLEVLSAFVDESARLSEKAIMMLETRIRHKLNAFCECGMPTFGMKVKSVNPDTQQPISWACPKCHKDTAGLIPKMLHSCNPTRNWIYSEYYLKYKNKSLENHKAFVQSLANDNQFISPQYIKSLQRQSKQTQDRLLYGSWEYQDELNMFDEDRIAEIFQYIDYPDEEPEEKTADVDGFKIEKNYIMTIDVARLGEDRSCILVWDELKVVHLKEISKMKLNEQLPFIQQIQNKYNIYPRNIIVDSDGVGGGIADMIPGCKPIVNNSRPIGGENFQNLKTQLYFKLAEYVNSGKIKVQFHESRGLDKESFRARLTQELQILKRITADWDGKVKMTSKDEVKKQISRSPDLSDAMAFRMFLELKSSGWGYDFAIV